MMKRMLALLLPALMLCILPGLHGQDKDKKKEKTKIKDKAKTPNGATKEIVVYAKATKRLSGRLVAIKMSGGTAVNRVNGNGVVVRVSAAKHEAVKAKFKTAGYRVATKKPEKVKPAEELVISYKKAPTAAHLAKMGLKVLDRHKLSNKELLLVRTTKPLDAAMVEKLDKDADLEFAEMNQELFLPPFLGDLIKKLIEKLKSSPNDPHYTKLWGMKNIHAPTAWAKGNSAPSIVVAVIDTGVDLGHEDLKAHLVKGYNSLDPKKLPQDDNGHGTHCAGTIGAIGNNKKGVVGVCWKVKIMPCKFLDKNGSGSTFNAIKCIDFARQNGAKIMSNSWGGGSYSKELDDAIGRANKAGILFVAAAGNSGTDNDKKPHYPSSYKQANILAVAAIDISDKLATFSCFGKTSVDIGAPGVSIFSTVPKTGKLGDASGYKYLNGTSMATPHVSGAAALILGRPKYATYKAPGLKKLILANARKIPALSGKCTTGGTLDIAFLGK